MAADAVRTVCLRQRSAERCDWRYRADCKLFQFNKTNLSFTANVFPAISQPGRVYTNFNATYYIKISGTLSWNVSFYGNWDNQPPPTFSGSDYGTSSGLSITFGNK